MTIPWVRGLQMSSWRASSVDESRSDPGLEVEVTGRRCHEWGYVMRQIVIPVLMLVATIGCGGGSETDVRTRSGPTQFTGKYAVYFQYDAWVSSISASFDDPDGGSSSQDFPITSFELYVMDAPWDCSGVDGGPQPVRDVAELIWSINRPKPRSLTTGVYPFGGAGLATTDWSGGTYFDWRPECLAQWTPVTGGSVTLSRLTEAEAQGFVSASLYDGTRIDGEFAATRCPAVFPTWPDGGIPESLPRCGAAPVNVGQR